MDVHCGPGGPCLEASHEFSKLSILGTGTREPLLGVVRRINSGGASSMTVPVLMRFNEGFLSYFPLLFTVSSGHSIYRSLAVLPPPRP